MIAPSGRRMRRRLRLVIAVSIVAAGGYFLWGLILEFEYEGMLRDLGARGDPVTWADLEGEPVPAEENCLTILSEVAAALDRIEDELTDEDELIPIYPDGDGWTEADRELHRETRARMEPWFDRVSEALERPVLALPLGESPIDGPDIAKVVTVLNFLWRRGSFDAGAAPETVDQILALAARWSARISIECNVRMVARGEAMKLMRRDLSAGPHDGRTRWGRWSAGLAQADPIEDLRTALISERVARIWLTDRHLEGVDPFDASRPGLEELRREIAESRTGMAEADETLERLADALPVPPRPWYLAWYARPFLYRDAIRKLEALGRAIDAAGSADSVRESLTACLRSPAPAEEPDLPGGAEGVYLNYLTHASALRLGRLALEVASLTEERGEPPASLDAFPADLTLDPLTGATFRYSLAEGEIRITSDGPERLFDLVHESRRKPWDEKKRTRLLEESHLAWRIGLD